tara:strand:+ start:141 stop:245 length:105 start_codon:yes stop_codon:yes gene_type:complete
MLTRFQTRGEKRSRERLRGGERREREMNGREMRR